MRTFGDRSKGNLANVHPLLVKIATGALENGSQDFTVICGHRDKAGQDAALRNKTTKVAYPNSAHNQLPSCAIDVIPYPFTDWSDPKMLTAWKSIADAMFAEAERLNVKIRWGGDFNRDGNKTSSDAWDKPHFELHPWRDYAKK
jgi:peptidoglycan L-alanyl-D-glutamate endopeptidase CwlK